MENLGQAMQGVGAWFSGRGPEYERQQMLERRYQQEQEKELSAERKRAQVLDFADMYVDAKAGNLDRVLSRVADRKTAINALGGNTVESDFIENLARTGQQELLTRELGEFLALPGVQQYAPEIKGLFVDPDAEFNQWKRKEDYKRENPDPGDALDRNLRGRELDLRERTEDRQRTKLSAPAENALIQAQDSYNAADMAASEASLLAAHFERMTSDAGGAAVSFLEGAKKFFGGQDEYTEFRRRYNKVRLSQGLKNLPPGPATDKDMIEAFKGVPAENAPPSQIASFLRGVEKMSMVSGAYDRFKAAYISDQGNTRGMIAEWDDYKKSPQFLSIFKKSGKREQAPSPVENNDPLSPEEQAEYDRLKAKYRR